MKTRNNLILLTYDQKPSLTIFVKKRFSWAVEGFKLKSKLVLD